MHVRKKTGGSRTVNTEEKRRHFRKKIVVGHQITPGKFFSKASFFPVFEKTKLYSPDRYFRVRKGDINSSVKFAELNRRLK